MIVENISTKKKLEEKLYEILSKGLYKYIKRIFEKKMKNMVITSCCIIIFKKNYIK